MAEPKKLSLEDKNRFDAAYSSLDMPLADLSFSMMYVWNAFLNVRWMDINGNLCVFTDFDDSTALWGPPLPGNKLESTVEECFGRMKDENQQLGRKGEPKIYYIPQELYDAFRGIPRFQIIPQDQDFVYTSDSLIELGGSRLKKKRYMCNYFQRNYNYSVADFSTGEYAEGCQELLRRWKKQKSPKVDEKIRFKFEAEALTAKQTIEYAEILGLKGIVVSVDGRVEGFTFGGRLNGKMANIMVEKTNLNIKGLAEFMYREFVRRQWASYTYVNAGEDWGVDYLTQSKMSYQPKILLKSFSLVEGGR